VGLYCWPGRVCVTRWLADGLVKPELLHQTDEDGDTAFSDACLAYSNFIESSAAAAAAAGAKACALALLRTGWVAPDTAVSDGDSHCDVAERVGLTEVLDYWRDTAQTGS
jgi:hypothetical protein